jgi:hypothetical protein
MHIPYSIRGALFGPALIVVIIILKMFCPTSIGTGCFADYLAVPVFLPLILLYATTGEGLVLVHELWFIFLYWSFIGLLLGLIFDLRTRQSPYLPAQRPLP